MAVASPERLRGDLEKVRVASRGELVARLFFEHNAQRLTDAAPVGSKGRLAAAAHAGLPPGSNARG
jgi:hypothetical protein